MNASAWGCVTRAWPPAAAWVAGDGGASVRPSRPSVVRSVAPSVRPSRPSMVRSVAPSRRSERLSPSAVPRSSRSRPARPSPPVRPGPVRSRPAACAGRSTTGRRRGRLGGRRGDDADRRARRVPAVASRGGEEGRDHDRCRSQDGGADPDCEPPSALPPELSREGRSGAAGSTSCAAGAGIVASVGGVAGIPRPADRRPRRVLGAIGSATAARSGLDRGRAELADPAPAGPRWVAKEQGSSPFGR